MSNARSPWMAWSLGLALLASVVVWARPLMPLDETRYVAVAWEMWLRGDFLVPFKNGETYSHKPPLLFWMIHAGWWAFGVNDLWPRLLSPLLGLASLAMTWRMARRLWPDTPLAAEMAVTVLFSGLLWMLYSTSLMFDVLVTACALLGLWALVERASGGRAAWWGVFALSVGLGILAKGPAILVHLLPAALLAPWWGRSHHLNLRAWYGGLVLSLIAGVLIGLAWAIPAGLAGGEAYRQAIFWGQTANRVVQSFAHQRPVWWYLALLPVFLFPWLLWPTLWRRLAGLGDSLRHDVGARFALVWFTSGLLIFSFISGKQPHYILPELPAFALLCGLALSSRSLFGSDRTQQGRAILPALLLLGTGALVEAAPHLVKGLNRELTDLLVSGTGFGLVALGIVLAVQRGPVEVIARRLGWISLAAYGWLWVILSPLTAHYDFRPLAQAIHQAQRAGQPVAHEGKYHAQFQFLGHLKAPLEEIEGDLAGWLDRHPSGALVAYFPARTAIEPFQPVFVQRFRTGYAALLDSRAVPALRASGNTLPRPTDTQEE